MEANVVEEKKNPGQLTREDLKEVKGGIPYEQPDLIELSNPLAECGVGRICAGGSGTTCKDGSECTNGKTGPDTSINPT